MNRPARYAAALLFSLTCIARAAAEPAPPQPAPKAHRHGHGQGQASGKGHGHGHGQGHGDHRFTDPEKWARTWDSPERDRWQKPDLVIQRLALTPAMRVAEIGSGTGYFTVRLARQVPRGKAYGADIEPGMVEYLARRARKEKLPQLQAVRASATDPNLPEPVDLILLVNTYHHIEGRPDYFFRLRTRLRPGGRLVLVEFKKGPLPVGPPESMRIDPAQLDRELTKATYGRRLLDQKLLPYQYLAIYVPAPL